MESQCPKCDSRKIKKELFRMATGGKWTARQRDFDGYYCQACGYVLGLYRPL
ncbi:MAG: acetyltransferase [Chloroflexi bacterium]|nr:acetyltransferase [Chloroflexota bacterium]MBT7080824.1 acetyltransferase [Chloroflexota bacterium]MBT7289037.1 acetyltransferase [Chloroflexota bacterium]